MQRNSLLADEDVADDSYSCEDLRHNAGNGHSSHYAVPHSLYFS